MAQEPMTAERCELRAEAPSLFHFRLRLYVKDEVYELEMMKKGDTAEKIALVRRALHMLGVHWPKVDIPFFGDKEGRITGFP